MPSSFETIVRLINKNTVPDQSLLLPYLCAESLEERKRHNLALATSFFASGKIEQAKVFIERAWLFSSFAEDVLPLYEEINRSVGDLDALREAYKRVGINRARTGGIGEALPYFFKSMYAYADNGRGDSYKFDFDVLNELGRLAEPFRFSPVMRDWKLGTRKLRIAYLVFGALHQQSVVVKILRSIGQHHDREYFEFAFFVPENELIEFSSCTVLRENIRSLESLGEIVAVTNGTNHTEALLDIASQIFDYAPDILVTSALLADLKQYYIASLCPAPVIIGLTMGPPQQFSAPLLDWSITFDPHCLMDCMSGCSRALLEIELPTLQGYTASRDSYGIPQDAVVIVAAGRPTKFLDRLYWETLAGIMTSNVKVYLIIVGLTQKPAFISDVINGGLVGRTIIKGWLNDYSSLLRISDIMVDTYPSGGGVTIMDAMGLGLPVVTFRNNYMHLFDQTDWSPGEWVVDIPELVAERDNWDSMRSILERLVDDRDYRMNMGDLCRQKAIAERGSPERMVRHIENVFQNVFLKTLGSTSSSISTATCPPDDLFFRDVMEKRINFWSFQEMLLQSRAVRVASFLSKYSFLITLALRLESVIKAFKKVVSR